MTRLGLPVVALLGVAVSACSTTTITPDIVDFGGAVESVAKKDAQAAHKRGLPKAVAAARRADLAAAGAVYTASDSEACSYTYPALAIAPPRFSEACHLIAKNERGQIVATVFDPIPVQEAADIVAPTRNKAIARDYLALKITEDLERYAAGLQELSESDLPEEIGGATTKAYSAATGLIDAVRTFAAIEGEPAPKRKEIGSFLTKGVTELAEAARYRRLRSIVDYADPFVQKAAVQLATLAYERDKPKLEPLAFELQEGLNDFDGGTEAGLARIEQAYASLTKADKAAHFRIYSDIGLGHRAIRDSLREGASVVELAKANKRIADLAQAAKALVAE